MKLIPAFMSSLVVLNFYWAAAHVPAANSSDVSFFFFQKEQHQPPAWWKTFLEAAAVVLWWAATHQTTMQKEYLSPISRGGGKSTDSKKSSTPLLLNPRFLFKFMAGVGTASFAIPALIAPEFMHPLLVASGTDYPTDNTFYVYMMFALRECYLAASTFGMAAFMSAASSHAQGLWGMIVRAGEPQ
jgi:hypothetical protein